MMRSMFAGVSGLRNHQIRMDVIGNNIANVNTMGFKSSRVSFQEVFNQTIRGASAPMGQRGGTNPQQVGLGMTVASIDTFQVQGNLQLTGKMTDLAVQGNGFFIMNQDGKRVYTRAGNFDLDSQGYLIDPGSGMRVQGWMADATGALPVRDENHLSDIQVPVGQPIAAIATDLVEYSGNLNAAAATGDQWTTSVDVFDSKGQAHAISLTFTKQDPAVAPNTWAVQASSAEDGVIVSSPAGWQVAFDTSGQTPTVTNGTGFGVAFANSTTNVPFSGATYDATLDAAVTAGDLSCSQNVTVTDVNGANHTVTMTFTRPNTTSTTWTVTPSSAGTAYAPASWQVSDVAGTWVSSVSNYDLCVMTPAPTDPMTVDLDLSAITQFAAKATAGASERNGYTSGALESFTVDAAGTITGVYSNGLTKIVGQVGLSNFSNPAGLLKLGSNVYGESNNSGLKQIGEPGTAGRGVIAPGSLEMSNVDLSQEFTNMIITQRGFQANSRIITTSDEMLQELVNLKR